MALLIEIISDVNLDCTLILMFLLSMCHRRSAREDDAELAAGLKPLLKETTKRLHGENIVLNMVITRFSSHGCDSYHLCF